MVVSTRNHLPLSAHSSALVVFKSQGEQVATTTAHARATLLGVTVMSVTTPAFKAGQAIIGLSFNGVDYHFPGEGRLGTPGRKPRPASTWLRPLAYALRQYGTGIKHVLKEDIAEPMSRLVRWPSALEHVPWVLTVHSAAVVVVVHVLVGSPPINTLLASQVATRSTRGSSTCLSSHH